MVGEPRFCAGRAELARLLGDDAGYKREMGEALRLYKSMKAEGHVERLEKELGK